MKPIEFAQLGETIYYKKLNNGLNVYLLPKDDYNKTFATFTTKYGSIDQRFIPLGETEPITVPDGIAHFLEHKMFEDEDGDVFFEFSKQGASANAFTSFTRTAYLFSSTSNVDINVKTLIDFVQHPYFTEESVEKEKGIINQEIMMYDDNPDWRAYFGMIENMYHHHPVKIDIAGTIESISNITKEMLYTCYETFYHPSNMLLFIVGPINPNEMMKLIEQNQAEKTFVDAKPIQRFFDEEPATVAKEKSIIHMPVQMPKCMIGIKEKDPNRQGEDLLKRELAISILLDLMFGQSTQNYEKLFNEGLIDGSFSYDYSAENGFGFTAIGSDTKYPDKFANEVKTMIEQFKLAPLTEATVKRTIKQKLGRFLRSLNSPETIANQFTRYQFNECHLFDVVPILENMTTAYLEEVLADHFEFERLTVCQVVAEGFAEK